MQDRRSRRTLLTAMMSQRVSVVLRAMRRGNIDSDVTQRLPETPDQ